MVEKFAYGIESSINGRDCPYSIALCRKPVQFGQSSFDQFWLERKSVYPTERKTTANFQTILDVYWDAAEIRNAVSDVKTRETYILASLLPFTRQHGGRRIIRDAVLQAPARQRLSQRRRIESLDAELSNAKDFKLSQIEFRDETAKLIGPETIPVAAEPAYGEFSAELLSSARDLSNSGPPRLKEPLACWKRWMKGLARRGKNKNEKRALDIISCEARAAFHRCYSNLWSVLLPLLAHDFQFTMTEWLFHRFWHLAHCNRVDDASPTFHLFHGHIFGLHPGTGMLLLTKAGTELMGNWLEQPKSELEFHRLFGGLCIALNFYVNQAETRNMPR